MTDGSHDPVVRDAGDSAVLVELGGTVDEASNCRALAAAAFLRASITGIREVVATYRSVAVYFDPLAVSSEELHAVLAGAAAEPVPPPASHVVELPVAYGREFGADLGEVARHVRMSEGDVIARHSAPAYRVFMIGFIPGFPYLGGLDPALVTPRRSSPRLRVPAGSVGIGGAQTGVYPRDTPGGWQLIGRTDAILFDHTLSSPSLLAAGDTVRFVPVDSIAPASKAPDVPLRCRSGRSVRVVQPGLLTTIQDGGRWGYLNLGVPIAGPMDPVGRRFANQLVGNDEDAAVLEATVLGPALQADFDAVGAITGADLGATLDGVPVALNQPFRMPGGSTLRFGGRVSGCRAYVAFSGGIDTPHVLGSRATHLPSGLGHPGRPLRAGDSFDIAEGRPGGWGRESLRIRNDSRPQGGARVRVIPGPQAHHLEPAVLRALQEQRFVIRPDSNRMGYRLKGTIAMQTPPSNMISDATFTGSVQVPPSGEPIVLMADRATTGGYPQVATIISADLPVVAQLAPGDWLEFETCSRADALRALAAQERELLGVH